MIEETVKYLENNYKHSKICVLATDGTVKTNIYGKNNNLNINYPNETIQKQVMEVIYKTKSPEAMNLRRGISARPDGLRAPR